LGLDILLNKKFYTLTPTYKKKANLIILFHFCFELPKVIHGFLNNGQELNDRTFTRILSRIYPDHSEVKLAKNQPAKS